MRKIRYGLTFITLLASLSGFTFFGVGSSALATTATSHHVTASSVAGQSAMLLKGQCPGATSIDC